MKGKVLGLSLAAAACGAPSLEGSLSTRLNLGYQRAEVEYIAPQLSLRFIRTRGQGEDTVLQLTLLGQTQAPPVRTPIDISEDTVAQKPRAQITRNVLGDPNTSLTTLQRGALTLDNAVLPGASVTGQLSATFTEGTELSSGQTVFGHFAAKVR